MYRLEICEASSILLYGIFKFLVDFADVEHQPINLSSSRHCFLSSSPLSNKISESTDSIDCISPYSKQESTMTMSNYDRNHCEESKSLCKIARQHSNFSIARLLSSSVGPQTYEYLRIPYKQVSSIFSKKKIKHFSDQYLHRIIIRHRKKCKHKRKFHLFQYSYQPRGIFFRFIFDSCNDLINQKIRMKNEKHSLTTDALVQLADIACKLDTRNEKSILNKCILTSKNYQLLLKQCHSLTKQIHRKYQHKKVRKRLSYKHKFDFKNRFIHFSLSILNLLKKEKNNLLLQSKYCNLKPDTQINSMEKNKIKEMKSKRSICFRLKPEQITSNLEVLLPNNNLLYEGGVEKLDNYDDLLLVRLNHERQTYLLPIHDLCRLACPKMIPKDFHVLSKGLRVCAFWSTSLRGLHPAIVKKLPSEINQSSMVGLLFDDGDTGLIKLNEIRLLPDDYDMKGMLKESLFSSIGFLIC